MEIVEYRYSPFDSRLLILLALLLKPRNVSSLLMLM